MRTFFKTLTACVAVCAGMLVRPVHGSITITETPQALYMEDDTLKVKWVSTSGNPCTMYYGTTFGVDASDSAISVTHTDSISFVPSDEGIPAGNVYQCVLYDGTEYSMEFQFILQTDQNGLPGNSNINPAANDTLTTTGELTPTFRWEAKTPTVPYYHLVVSDQVINVAGDTIKGISAIYQAIIPGTEIQYMTPDPSGRLDNVTPPPLLNNTTYYWMVLNNFGGTVAYTSETFGNPFKFNVDVPALDSGLTKPVLSAPADSTTESGGITFIWTPITGAAGAVTYTVYLYEKREIFGNFGEFLIWRSSTNDTATFRLDNSDLRDTYYKWRVVAETGSRRIASDFSYFNFDQTIRKVKFRISSSFDGSRIPRVIVSTADSIPMITDDNGYCEADYYAPASPATDSLKFGLRHPAYHNKDTTIVLTYAVPGDTGDFVVNVEMRPHLAAFRGVVRDSASGSPLNNVTVNALGPAEDMQAFSNSEGGYRVMADSGSWNFFFQKDGYETQSLLNRLIDDGEYQVLPTIDLVEKSGTFNITVDDGSLPIASASIYAFRLDGGDTTSRINGFTNSSGQYSFTAWEGFWKVYASKAGYDDNFASATIADDSTENRTISLNPQDGVITGTVLDSLAGTGLVGARVIAVAGATRDTTLSGVGGAYLYSASPDTYMVYYEMTGYLSDSLQVVVGPGETKTVQMRLLEDIGYIRGVVTDSAGTLLQGALVRVVGRSAQDSTDGSGAYFLSTASGNGLIVRAAKSGYISAEDTVDLNAAETLTVNLTLEEIESVIRGRIIMQLDSTAVESARVYDQLGNEAYTDAAGDYVLNVKSGPHTVQVDYQGYVSIPGNRSVVASVNDTIDNQNFQLKAGVLVQGTITGGGSPLGGARVVFNRVGTGLRDTVISAVGTGSYDISLDPPGDWSIQVSRSGYLTSVLETLTVDPGDTITKNVDLIPDVAYIRGVVRDNGAGLLDSVRVYIVGREADAETTDASGVYLITTTSGLALEVRGEKTGYVSDVVPGITLDAGDTVTVNLTLDEIESVIRGQVTMQSGGAAVESVRVYDQLGNEAYTDASGNYLLNVLSGAHTIEVDYSGYYSNPVSRNVTVAVNDTITGRDFQLIPSPGMINGTVTSGGTPLGGAAVIGRLLSGGTPDTAYSVGGTGNYSFSINPPGEWILYAVAAGYVASDPETVLVNPGATVNGINFDLAADVAWIIGTVNDDRANLLDSVRVYITGRESQAETTDAAGQYVITTSSGLGLEVRGVKTGYVSDIVAGINLNAGDTVTVDLTLDEIESVIRGQVTMQSGGAAVESVRVFDQLGNETYTDASGNYSLDVLSGSHTVEVSYSGYYSVPLNRSITISVNDTISGRDFALVPSPGVINGTVTSGGSALGGASIIGRLLGGSARDTVLSAGGTGAYSMNTNPPGEWILYVQAAGYVTSAPETILVNPGATVNGTDFDLTADVAYVRGTVRDDQGVVLDSARVLLVGRGVADTTNASGTYFITTSSGVGLTIRGSKAGYVQADSVIDLSVGDTVTVNLTLDEIESVIRGRVVALPGSAAVESARVYDQLGNEDYTDASGNYQLDVLSGSHTVRVSYGGYTSSPVSRAVNVSPADTITGEDFVLSPNAVTIWGYVRSGGAALGNAQVTATKGATADTVSSASGTGLYSFSVQYGTWLVRAARSGYVTSAVETLATAPGDSVQQDFNLTADVAYVRGTVRDDQGGVLDSARVSLVGRGVADTTDASGTYFIATSSGAGLTVRGTKAGYVQADSVISLNVGDTVTVDLTLDEIESVIRGRVVALPGSTAVVNARVYDQLGNEDYTDGSGNYQLDVLSGSHTVRVSYGGYTSSPVSRAVNVSPADTITGEDFVLSPNAVTIWGYVRSGGAALGNAQVTATKGATVDTAFSASGTGLYSFSVQYGTWLVRAARSGYVTSAVETLATAPGDSVQQDFSLTADVAYVRGTVRDDQGGVLDSARVSLVGRGVADTTDASGTYFITTSSGAGLTVRGTKDGYVQADSVINLNVGDTVTVDLTLDEIESVIRGRVVALPGSTAVVNARVYDQLGNEDYSDGSGNYQLDVLSGSHTVRVSYGGYTSSPVSRAVNVSPADTITGEDFVLSPNAVTIWGYVRSGGAALGNAQVTAAKGATADTAFSASGTGLYSFSVQYGTWLVRAARSGYVTSAVETLATAPGDSVQQDFNLTADVAYVRGTVRDDQGGVLDSARVSLVGRGVADTTDASGSYFITTSSGVGLTVRGSKAGYVQADSVISLNVGDTVTVNLTLDEIESVIRGRVVALPGSAAVESARVYDQLGNEDYTDASGDYELDVLSGFHTIKVSYTAYTSTPDSINAGMTVNDTLSGQNFVLNPNAGVIQGYVRSGGVALGNALVQGASGGNTASDNSAPVTGFYQMSVEPGTWIVRATNSGYLDSDPETLSIAPGATANLDFDLIADIAYVRGWVAASGVPLAGAVVEIVGAGEVDTSDISGAYFITTVSGSGIQVRAAKAGYSTDDTTLATLAPGDTATASFNLSANPHLITGLVTSNTGDTLGNAALLVTAGSDSQNVSANGQGVYEVWVGQGNNSLQISLAGYVTLDTSTNVGALDDTVTVDIVLTENFATVTGRVRDNTGPDIDSAQIVVTGANGTYTGRTNSGGIYTISGIIPGTYQVTASKAGYQVVPSQVDTALAGQSSSTFNFTMFTSNGTISGTVVQDVTGGSGIPVATVVATEYGSGNTYSAVTDSQGNYTLSGLPTFNTDFGITTYKTGFTALASAAVESINAGDAGVELILFINDGILAGSALLDSATGPGAGGRTVTLQQLGGASYTVNTAASGAFSKTDLPPSEAGYYYRVSVNALNGYTTPTALDSVQPDDSGLLLLYTRQTGVISGTVMDDTSGAVAGANVDVYDYGTGNSYSGLTDGTGAFSVSGLPSLTEFRVSASAPGYTGLNGASVESVATGSTGVALELYINDGILAGSALLDSATGPGAGGRTVTLQRLGGASYTVNTGAAGAFSKTDLPPSEAGYYYRVSVNALTGYSTPAALDSVQPDDSGLLLLYTRQTGVISGTVTDDTSGAVAGANVDVYDYGTGNSYSGLTDGTGAFSVSGLPSLTDFRVSASAPGYTALATAAVESVATGTGGVGLELYINDGILAGSALLDSATGPGAGGRTVTLQRLGGASYTVNTGAAGAFSKTDLPPSEAGYYYRVWVNAFTGYTTPVAIDSVQPDTTGLLLLYTRQTGVISGTVADDTAGIVIGANVEVYDYGTGTGYSGLSDSTGAFAVSGLPSLTVFRVSASAPGYSDLATASMESVATGSTGVALELYINDGVISGSAYYGAAGTAGAGGKVVTIQRIGGSSRTANTLSDGSFSRTDLPPSEAGYYYNVTIESEAGYTRSPASYDSMTTDTTGLVFRYIANTAVISGTVVYDASDTSGAGIGIDSADVAVYDYGSGLYTYGKTDAAGDFSVTGLDPAGTFRVETFKSGMTALPGGAADSVPAGSTAISLVLYKNDGLVSGTVTYDSTGGTGVGGKQVTIQRIGGASSQTSTGPAGAFAKADLPPAETGYLYRVSVPDDEAGYTVNPAVFDSLALDTTGLAFIYEKNAGTLFVRVVIDSSDTSAAGIGLDSVTVTVRNTTTDDLYPAAKTDGNGFTVAAGLPAGAVMQVTGAKAGYTLLAANIVNGVVPGDSVTVVMHKNDGLISGTAYYNPPGDSGVTGKLVTITRIGGASYTTNTVNSGAFTHAVLPPSETGNYYRISLPDNEPGYYLDPLSIDSVQADSAGLAFLYQANVGAISGIVSDDTGGVVNAANVVALDLQTSLTYSAVTAANGAFTVSGLPAGALFNVSVSKTGYTALNDSGSALDSVATGSTGADLKLWINDGIISGHVYTDSVNGPAVEDVPVVITRQGGSPRTVRTDTTGAFILTGLPPAVRGYLYDVDPDTTLPGYNTPAGLTGVPVDSTGISLVYQRIINVLKVVVLYAADSSGVEGATVILENKAVGEDTTVTVTSSAGVYVFDTWSQLNTDDTYKVTAEKYGETDSDNRDNFQLIFTQDTTMVTLYLSRVELASIEIRVNGKTLEEQNRFRNRVPHTCTYLAKSTTGVIMHLDPDSTEWSHEPYGAVSLADADFYGALTEVNSAGDLQARLNPDTTGFGEDVLRIATRLTDGGEVSATRKIVVYAPLTQHTMPASITLRQYRGMKLTVQAADLPDSLTVGFAARQSGVSLVKSSTAEYKVQGSMFRVSFINSDNTNESRGSGTYITSALDLELPVPSGLDASASVRIGMWSIKDVSWTPLTVTSSTGTHFGTQFSSTESGEFAVIVSSEKLGLSNVDVRPNPFSPYVGNLGISFDINSKETREPLVTARVFSVRGDPVATICLDKHVNKGNRVLLEWNGRNDVGRMCRNGRYKLVLTIEDPSGTKTVYKPIYLIK